MKFEKLVSSQNRLASDVDADNRLHFTRKGNASASATGGRVTRAGILTTTAGGANVEVSLPTFQVRFVADKGHSIPHPLKKLDIVARAKNLFGFVINVVDLEHI
jgi:hypothetical protein